jgi:hypothetical protein
MEPRRIARVATTAITLVCGACGSSDPAARARPAEPPVSIELPPRQEVPVASSTTVGDVSSVPSAPPAPSSSAEPGPSDPLSSADAERANDAVAALPGVKGLCAEAIARGASGCGTFPAEAPKGPCPKPGVAYENEDCWWGVALMETMSDGQGGGHGNRMATFWVEPKTFKVVAANDFACADLLFTLEAFRKLQVRRAKPTKQDDCDGSLPYPTAP